MQTTQNIYTHVFDDAKRQAADALDQILEGKREDRLESLAANGKQEGLTIIVSPSYRQMK